MGPDKGHSSNEGKKKKQNKGQYLMRFKPMTSRSRGIALLLSTAMAHRPWDILCGAASLPLPQASAAISYGQFSLVIFILNLFNDRNQVFLRIQRKKRKHFL